MVKRVKHSREDHKILAYAIIFLLAGFFFTSTGNFKLTGLSIKEEPCRLVKDSFSNEYCRGINENKHCVWNKLIKDCKLVNSWNVCNRNNPDGFCYKPTDKCTSIGLSSICMRKY